jgi:hypothetical protein
MECKKRIEKDVMSKTNYGIHIGFCRHFEFKTIFLRFTCFNECKRIKHNTETINSSLVHAVQVESYRKF